MRLLYTDPTFALMNRLTSDRFSFRASAVARRDLAARETAEAHELALALPGVDPSRIALAVEGTRLTVRVRATEGEGVVAHYEFPVAPTVDAGSISADASLGVLRIRMPKRPEAAAREIPLTVGAAVASATIDATVA